MIPFVRTKQLLPIVNLASIHRHASVKIPPSELSFQTTIDFLQSAASALKLGQTKLAFSCQSQDSDVFPEAGV
jgi:hypothetical protein